MKIKEYGNSYPKLQFIVISCPASIESSYISCPRTCWYQGGKCCFFGKSGVHSKWVLCYGICSIHYNTIL